MYIKYIHILCHANLNIQKLEQILMFKKSSEILMIKVFTNLKIDISDFECYNSD